jgi:CRISPR-associated DxTHG motif protein
MRNVFLSFLGTSRYIPCNYFFPGREAAIADVAYIQEALVSIFCGDYTEDDRCFFFLTSEAKANNWYDHAGDGGTLELGLSSRLQGLLPATSICPVTIANGNSEQEIWQIFTTVFDCLAEGDRVILDITHGFRSLPMLGMVLLDYARFLKNITVKGIYYGAFEALGPAYKVREMARKDPKAPILDLTSFDTLQQWASGADHFIHFGNPEKIAGLVQDQVQPVLSASKGQDQQAKFSRELAMTLRNAMLEITTARGGRIISGKTFLRLQGLLHDLAQEDLLISALAPLLQKIETKVAPFRCDDLHNGFFAVKWCMEHGYVQQGITLLQEMIITWSINQHGGNWHEKKEREFAAACLNVFIYKIPETKWNPLLKGDREKVNAMLCSQSFGELAAVFSTLTEHRNDINHGGFSSHNTPGSFKKILAAGLEKAKTIIDTQ